MNSFVDGTGVTPPPKIRNSSNEEVTNPDFLQWLVDDAHLMSCISGTLTSAIYSVVLNCNTSREAWTSIEKRFTTLSRSHVHQLKNRLNSMTKNTSTMEVYLQQIKGLSDQLTLTGATIDDEDLVLITHNGLSDEFRAFKTSIRTRPFPITMEELCSLLLSEAIHEDSSLKSSQSSSDLTVAFATSRGGYQGNGSFSRSYAPQNRGSYSSQKRGYRGNSRGFRGNSRRFSANRGGYRGGGRTQSFSGNSEGNVSTTYHQSGSSSHRQSSGIVCQICDKPGHTAVNCWHRLNTDYQPQVHSGSYHSQNKAFVTTVPEQSTSNWYVDSAASTHITNDLSITIYHCHLYNVAYRVSYDLYIEAEIN